MDGWSGRTYLEVDNNSKDECSSQQVGKIGEILAIESFLQSSHFVLTGDQQMEQCNDSSFEFSSYTIGYDMIDNIIKGKKLND